MVTDTLESRMRNYEQKYKLPEYLPVIIRIDGRAFHSLTRGMDKPFDHKFIALMDDVGTVLCKEVQNCRMAYIQSDEINLLLYQKRDSQPWFGSEIQKITSITASIASSVFTASYDSTEHRTPVVAFDSRAFVLPPHEVVNYFIWRQNDWIRNSIQMMGRAHFSHRELNGVSTDGILELLKSKDLHWDTLFTYVKRGRTVVKIKTMELIESVDGNPNDDYYERSRWTVDSNIPIFTDDRDYIESKLEPEFALDLGKTAIKVEMKVR